jgi:HptB-dependent secretion and biofilm anti anti-sigma factor
MSISAKVTANTATISMTGRFDFSVQRDFKEAYAPQLANSAVSAVEVNLAGVEYLDSSALGMLLMLRERAEAAGKSVKLCKPSASVAQILEIANFSKLFTIV